jgi:hypothetical protein
MWMFIIVVAVALWAVYQIRRNTSSLNSAVRLAGDGRYAVDVVGESKYLASFEKICGPRSRDGVNMNVRAHLTLENNNPADNLAVLVSIHGHTVGYLSRTVARDFRRAVGDAGHGRARVFECSAVIKGGWDNGRDRQGNYGVWLDLPVG